MRDNAPMPVEFFTESTRAFSETTTSNLNGFYVTARNTSGTVLWENVHFVQDEGGSRFTGGVYWPITGSLSFYAISRSYPQTFDGNSILVQPSPADGDVVSALKTNVSNGSTPSLYFGHIFAELDAILFTPADGCSIEVTALNCSFITGGTYDISTASWADTGAPGAAVPVASPSLENRDLGLLCVPASGNCTIDVSYDCTFCGYTRSYTSSATVTLPMGSRSTVNGTLQAGSGAMALSIIIDPWDEDEIIQYEL